MTFCSADCARNAISEPSEGKSSRSRLAARLFMTSLTKSVESYSDRNGRSSFRRTTRITLG